MRNKVKNLNKFIKQINIISHSFRLEKYHSWGAFLNDVY